MKKTFFAETAYFFGILLLTAGTALMERADFGMSMIVAPAYLLHLKISEYVSFFTFGMAEYVLQACLLIVLALIQRRFSRAHLFSFITAVFYGFVLDGAMSMIALMPFTFTAFRVICFASGMMLCAAGVSMLFHTYISPEAYELFVLQLSQNTGSSSAGSRPLMTAPAALSPS